MRFTIQLRTEHDLLIGLADALRQASRGDQAVELPRLLVLLGQFTQLLQVHLLREDGVLYPALAASRDRAAAAAQAVFEEHGMLGRQVAAFERSWTADEIRRRWTEFAAELTILLEAVSLRIDRENDELYPLLEQPEDVAA